MSSSVAYKNCLIRCESMQLAHSGGWSSRYTLTLRDAFNKWNGAPAHHDRLDQIFPTENEADRFAFQAAMLWIDNN